MSHIGPSLIPLHTKPLAAYAIEFYLNNLPDAKVYLAVNDVEYGLVQSEFKHYEQSVYILGIKPNRGVVDTLSDCLNQMDEHEQVTVQLVTTVPTLLTGLNEVLLDDRTSVNKHWSTVVLDTGGQMAFFGSKAGKPLIHGHAFTGTFRCSTHLLRGVLREGVERPDDLLLVVQALHQKRKLKPVLCEWVDCGHEVNYYRARLSNLQSRSFNHVRLVKKGILVKSSSNRQKIEEELNYLRTVPEDFQPLFPRLFGETTLEGYPAYSMEYYGYPVVSELQLYWELPEQVWERFYATLSDTIQGFQSVRSGLEKDDYQNMHITKLISRTEMYRKRFDSEEERSIFRKEWRINGSTCKSLDALMPDLEREVDRMYQGSFSCMMHGDLCFGNMLYDISSDIIRLIDPRGRYGNHVGIFGDQYYDLAKLCHSSLGHYDYLVNHLFHMHLDVERNQCNLTFNLRDNDMLHRQLTDQLLEKLNVDKRRVCLLMALLFLSMPIIHDESRNRSLAMYMHGLSLINRYLS